MKASPCKNRDQGITLLELFVIMAVLSVLAIALFPPQHGCKAKATRIQCVNNLKQIGLATRVWEGDHGDKYPLNISRTHGGAMEFASGANAWRTFEIMSNELSTPKVLVCSTDTRIAATNFHSLRNSNISFFVGLDMDESNPEMLLAGDRNLTNGTMYKNGILEITTNTPPGWTAQMHNHVGNIALADGSVQQLSQTGLRAAVQNTSVFSNRLFMPILGP